jgi:hypothetical protein
MKKRLQRAILNFTPGPRGEIRPLGEMFAPSFTPRGKHSLLFRRMEGRTENFTPRGQLHPWGQSLPLGAKLRISFLSFIFCRFKAFVGLSNLTSLSLRGNILNSIDPLQFAGLTNLVKSLRICIRKFCPGSVLRFFFKLSQKWQKKL